MHDTSDRAGYLHTGVAQDTDRGDYLRTGFAQDPDRDNWLRGQPTMVRQERLQVGELAQMAMHDLIAVSARGMPLQQVWHDVR